LRSKNHQSSQLIKMNQQIDEVSPPGWGHTKPDKKKGMKVGGTAAAMKKAKAEGRMPGVKNIFALMWSMKNKGDKAHYKPGKKGVKKMKYKKKKKKKNEERELIFQANKQIAYVIAEGIFRSTVQALVGAVPVVGDVAAAGMDVVGDAAQTAQTEKEVTDKEREKADKEAKEKEEEAKRKKDIDDQKKAAEKKAAVEKAEADAQAKVDAAQRSRFKPTTQQLAAHTEFQYKNAYVQRLMETRR
jgi:hypothetical protein